MDFWNWLWVLAFPALLLAAWLIITNMGKRALSRHLSEQTPVPTKKTLVQAQKDEWDRQFEALANKGFYSEGGYLGLHNDKYIL